MVRVGTGARVSARLLLETQIQMTPKTVSLVVGGDQAAYVARHRETNNALVGSDANQIVVRSRCNGKPFLSRLAEGTCATRSRTRHLLVRPLLLCTNVHNGYRRLSFEAVHWQLHNNFRSFDVRLAATVVQKPGDGSPPLEAVGRKAGWNAPQGTALAVIGEGASCQSVRTG